MAKLTAKQQRFIEEYMIDLNATQAAIRAGYSPNGASVTATDLLANTKIRDEVDKKMAERSKRTGVTQDRIIRELARIAFVDPTDVINMAEGTIDDLVDEDSRAAIASVKVKTFSTRGGQEIVEREVKLHDKIKALELLGKHNRMFVDRFEGDINGRVIINDGIPVYPDDDSDLE